MDAPKLCLDMGVVRTQPGGPWYHSVACTTITMGEGATHSTDKVTCPACRSTTNFKQIAELANRCRAC